MKKIIYFRILIGLIIIIFYSCFSRQHEQNYVDSMPNFKDTLIRNEYTYQEYDMEGNLILEYGNQGKIEHPSYFKCFKFYDNKNRLEIENFFDLGKENKNCIIYDSLDYSQTIFFYANNVLIKKEIYVPVRDKNQKIIRHELSYTFDVKKQVAIPPINVMDRE